MEQDSDYLYFKYDLIRLLESIDNKLESINYNLSNIVGAIRKES